MNKLRRRELEMLHYKRRIRRFVYGIDFYISRNGNKIHKPKSIDVIKDCGHHYYKSTSTPCSCICCSPYKYNRAKIKRQLSKVPTGLYDRL